MKSNGRYLSLFLVISLLSKKLVVGTEILGLQLQEVGDFEAQNRLPLQNLILNTKLHLTTEPPISCRCCYAVYYFFVPNTVVAFLLLQSAHS
jgi:hypothetical protein